MPCICKIAGCSQPRDCGEDFCTEHLLQQWKVEKEQEDCPDGCHCPAPLNIPEADG